MARQLGNASHNLSSPLRLAEEYRALLGQAALDALIRDFVPDTQWVPGDAHARLLELPWSDVLTTNWDTLLERTASDTTERSYEVVLTPTDIARTRSPRIVKLHGSLPSHTPFIFTEEDFRTYPRRFAPFVNLAQHVLLENELLLLGFSGDDPNFLAWAGWVRDQLGPSARRICLAGVLNLSPARRRYLENINVTPIDCSPLVSHIVDPRAKHAQATTLLLNGLHAAKPTPVYVWSRTPVERASGPSEPGEQPRIVALVENWKRDRRVSPAWLVAPYMERYQLRIDTDEPARNALSDLKGLPPRDRARFAAELAWRLETGHAGAPPWFRACLESALADSDGELGPDERARLIRLLAYQAIEDRDFARLDELTAALDRLSETDESAAWAAYFRALSARDRLDLAGVAAALPAVVGDDPVWMLRRAALHCVIDESKSAARLVRDALRDIARRRRRDRRSIWLLSREAWARFLWGHLFFELRGEEGSASEFEREWPAIYTEHKLDPWDELNGLEVELRQEQERASRYARDEKAHFEPGSWTPQSDEPTHYVATWVVPVESQLRRLADFVGLPRNTGSTSVMGSRLARATETLENEQDEALVWRVATYLRSHDDRLMSQWFGRIRVAAMTQEQTDALTDSARGALAYLTPTLALEDDDWVNRVSHARVLLELLSRLAVRASPSMAGSLFGLGIAAFNDGADRHWWLYRPTGNLFARALSAIPPADRGPYFGSLLDFPVPAERPRGGLEEDWPEFSGSFDGPTVHLERPPEAWNRRISDLIAWVRRDGHNSRRHALLRLRLLHRKHLLSASEEVAFGAAIWSRRKSDQSLPEEERIYPAVFLELPEPAPGVARAAFNHDIVQPLLTNARSFTRHTLPSLAYVGSSATRGDVEWPYCSETALRLLKSMPKPTDKQNDADIGWAIFSGVLPLVELDDAALEDLRERAEVENARSATLFLPALARRDPDYVSFAINRLRRALNSRDYQLINYALSAIRAWARDDEAGFPTVLSGAVAAFVALRRDPGLFRALDLCVWLVEQGQADGEHKRQMLDGLADLLTETDYIAWRPGDFRTATLTFIRANCYRLARALEKQSLDDPVIAEWLIAGKNDPLPEVRFADGES